jgi:hypothetical protein
VSSGVVSECTIILAVNTFRNYPALTDEAIYHKLVKHGLSRVVAARLVEFLPSAYCRVILESTGARFAESFRRKRRDGTISHEIELKSDPIWNAVIAFAQKDVNAGLSREAKLRLAGRSAEFQAANKLLYQGSKLENIAFTSAVLPWDENGPPTNQP